jgi:hypothetical protein
MILKKEEIIEKYPNGKISYIETRAIIAPMFLAIFPNHRIAEDGTFWIRTGVNRKFNSDGKLRWEIKYNDNGDVVKY